MFRRLGLVLAASLVVACGGGSGGSGASGGSGGIDSIGLQAGDVPSGFSRCSISGDVSQSSDNDVKGEWQYQQKQGATAGYMTVYAKSSSDCVSFIKATNGGSGSVLGSLVLQFKDSASASAGSDGGIFGANPNDMLTSLAAVQGAGTGLGANSTYGFKDTLGLATWWTGSYALATVANNVSEAQFKKASSAVFSRAH